MVISSEFKELYEGMTLYNVNNRYSLRKVKESAWYNGPVYTESQMAKIMDNVFKTFSSA